MNNLSTREQDLTALVNRTRVPKAKTGLERIEERYGENWRMVAMGEQPSIPFEVAGEYFQ